MLYHPQQFQQQTLPVINCMLLRQLSAKRKQRLLSLLAAKQAPGTPAPATLNQSAGRQVASSPLTVLAMTNVLQPH